MLVAVALGVHVDIVVIGLFFVFVPLLSLAMIPPITINGLGIREGLGILLFAGAGIGETDAFGYMFAAEALARLGNADDIPKIDKELEKLAEVRSGQTMQTIEGYLRPMKATLRGKGPAK